MQYMMLILASLLLAVDMVLNKMYQKLRGTAPATSLLFNAVLGFVTAMLLFFVNRCRLSFSLYSVLMAILMGGLVMAYTMIGFRVLKQGSVAIYGLFLMTGGMVLPYIWGLVFLNEPFRAVRTIGLLAIIGGVFLSNFSGEKPDCKQFGMCLAVFVLNGFVSIVSKLHQIERNYPCVSTVEFMIWGGILKFFIAGTLFLVFRNRTKQEVAKSNVSKSWLVIILSAVIGGLSYFLQLYGAKSLPATVLYPFITGGSIVFSVFADAIWFKENISRRLMLSVALCVAGTVMFI